MTISIDISDLTMFLLKGNKFGTEPVSLEFGDKLIVQEPFSKFYVLNKPLPTAMYYDLWTIEGWANECERLIYIAKLKPAAPLVKAKPFTRNELMDKLNDAIIKGDMNEMTNIQEQLKNV